LANSTDVPADFRTEQQLERSSLLVRVRWVCCGLVLLGLLLVLDRGRAPAPASLAVLAAIPSLNLAWTLLARRVRRAAHASILLLSQELLDAVVVAFLAAHSRLPALLALVLVPITAARDDLGRKTALLVVLGAALGFASG